ncbi:MAG: hypothetical protein LBK99_23085, partial [Opitutaceae bacterium]|nr:hypothetical protein [Opitutaceae bacterium]
MKASNISKPRKSPPTGRANANVQENRKNRVAPEKLLVSFASLTGFAESTINSMRDTLLTTTTRTAANAAFAHVVTSENLAQVVAGAQV